MKSCLLGILFFLFFFSLHGQNNQTGNIQGIVINKETKEGIVGATVFLQGTVLGTATDQEGKFMFKEVPAGSYVLVTTMIGFDKSTITQVEVIESQNTELSIELNSNPVQTQPVFVTASKHQQIEQDIPVAVSVMDGKEMTLRNSVSVDDALRYVPGVNFIQSQVNIRGSTGYSKGVGTRVLLLVDGLPMLSGDTGEIIWESLPTSNIERIEVVKGAGSALYGSGALGGVINVITKTPGDKPETHLSVYGGFYESPYFSEWDWSGETRFINGIQLTHQQKIDKVNVFATLGRKEDDGYQRNNVWKRWNGFVKLGYDFSPVQSLVLTAGIMDQRRGDFLYWQDLEHALEPPASQRNSRVESFRWNASALFKNILSSETYYTVKTGLYQTDWEDNDSTTLTPKGNRSKANYWSGEFQLLHQINASNILTTGLYGSANSVDADTIFGNHTGNSFAAYFQDEISLAEQLRLTVGGRFDVQSLEGIETEQQFNPKAGLTYNPMEETHLRLSIGRGFRAPSVAEVYSRTDAGGVTVLPNTGLRSEHSWSYEIGGTQVLSNNILAELSVFQNEFWDLIEPTFNTNGQVQFQNITRARIQGGEIDLRTSFLDGTIKGDAGYTFIYPRDISKNDLLKYRPRHLFYASGLLTLSPVEAGVDFRFISRMDRIDDEFVTLGIIKQGDERTSAYITDIHVSCDWKFIGFPLKSSLHANNIFQYHYVELIGNIAPLRNYVLSIEGSF